MPATGDNKKRIAREWARRNKQANAVRNKEWSNREHIKAKKALAYVKLRQTVLDAYGNKCKYCGESEPKFLAVDHVYNDGAEERKTKNLKGKNLYVHLTKLNFPQDRYQLLCHNCNMAKGFYGKCPHTQIDPA